ncbi:hypothetical protein DH2020_000160 [Rehmannia glutinosa]|uniref:NAC domain-containing protein n=1 Tax=Rehmannia glutinosa TaxID=99300 RepID=A0ABR0XVQ7_REHGL
MEEKKTVSDIQYPPGIRFHPSDEELITYYLQRKVNCLPLPANVITDIELYSYNPWDLPSMKEANRTAASGYWKATATDKPILSSSSSREIGVKKGLVFYKGKPPKGLKMDWIMTEYRLPDTSSPLRSKGSMRIEACMKIIEPYVIPENRKGLLSFQEKMSIKKWFSIQLDDWVLCRIRQKGNKSKNAEEDDQSSSELLDYLPKINALPSVFIEDSRDMLADYLLSSEHHLLASLLVGHDPEVVTIPRTTFQGHKSDNGSRIIREDRLGKMNTRAKFSLFESCFDSVPGQPKEENMYTNIQLPTNMIMYEQKGMVSQSGQMVATMGANSYCQYVSEGNKFKPNYSSNAYINSWELDMPALSENFL